MTSPTLPKPILAFFGHHKCGSTFVNIVLNELGRILGYKVLIQYLPSILPLDYHLKDPYTSRLDSHFKEAETGNYEILCHGNADERLLQALSKRGYLGFHVIRDPRDIVVSGYFSHRFSHPADEDYNPWLLDHRKHLTTLSEEDGLLQEVDFCNTYFSRLNDWNYNNPNILETRFELITKSPEIEYRRVLSFLGIEVKDFAPLTTASLLISTAKRKLQGSMTSQYHTCPSFILRRILNQASFERMAGGRKSGTENKEAHFRKGIAGDWKNYFTPKIKNTFKERYGNLIVKLGYEDNNDW